MNAKMMGQYIEFVADRWLANWATIKHYGAANPFDFMEMIACKVKPTSLKNALAITKKAA
jgi:ribonucleoside-diphosphate reductase beta chain